MLFRIKILFEFVKSSLSQCLQTGKISELLFSYQTCKVSGGFEKTCLSLKAFWWEDVIFVTDCALEIFTGEDLLLFAFFCLLVILPSMFASTSSLLVFHERLSLRSWDARQKMLFRNLSTLNLSEWIHAYLQQEHHFSYTRTSAIDGSSGNCSCQSGNLARCCSANFCDVALCGGFKMPDAKFLFSNRFQSLII